MRRRLSFLLIVYSLLLILSGFLVSHYGYPRVVERTYEITKTLPEPDISPCPTPDNGKG